MTFEEYWAYMKVESDTYKQFARNAYKEGYREGWKDGERNGSSNVPSNEHLPRSKG